MDLGKQWLLAADSRRATLYSCQQRDDRSWALHQAGTLPNTHEGEHEHHRPTLLGGQERRGAVTSSGAHAGPHSTAPGHDRDEELQRFVRELSNWVMRSVPAQTHAHVAIFAPPHLLGLLNAHAGLRGAKASFHAGDLTHLSEDQLGSHAAVRAALAQPNKPSTTP